MLVNGAGGAVGGCAVQLAKNAGAYVIATAGPRNGEQVAKADADEVVEHTVTEVTAVLPALIQLSGTVWMPKPDDERRGVRGVDLFVDIDAERPSRLAAMVDPGELRVDVARRVQSAELPSVRGEAAAGGLHGKVVVAPTD
ncbi:hypothetical protein ACFU96_17655 [Streptomyces sp. NPDC057620]|uniref:hypothetical protein n=1 Tax=Streptomyces sp. NPDC057620 TaxID=3346185 RepID=UPI0036A56391